jgi:hypothetical protein
MKVVIKKGQFRYLRKYYEICPICFWEDDGVDLNRIDEDSGPNHMSLREGRLNFMKFGACDSTMRQHVLDETQRAKFKLQQRATQ